jgi:D-3-phosphoglycerate dehydrogenase
VKKIHVATSMPLELINNLYAELPNFFVFHGIDDAIKSQVVSNKCEVLWVSLLPIANKELIDKFPNLKVVSSATTGTTHIDASYLESKNIEIISLKKQLNFLEDITATPEFAWGLMLDVWRKITLSSLVFDGDTSIRHNFGSYQLKGLSLGLIGFGRVGKRLAKYGDAFQMKIRYYDPYLKDYPGDLGYTNCKTLERLLELSDVIFLSASVIDNDYDLYPIINQKNVSFIKKGAVFVNVSRGVLVDENALARSLRSSNLFGVGTDVLRREEAKFQSDLRSELEVAKNEGLNVVITPHLAGMCHDAILKCSINIGEQIIKFLINQ